MRIPSGKTDIMIFFVAVDSTDLKTRETGLSGFTVYRCRNGGTPVAYTTPTVAECSAANMPGVYTLLIDEDTTIGASSDSEEYTVHITHASMSPVTRSIELYRRDTTSGRTMAVDASGRGLSDIDTIKTNPVVNGGTVTFPTTATLASTTNITAAAGCAVSSIGANVITAASINADAITDAKVASDVTIASVTGAVGSVTGAVGSVTAGVTVTTNNDKTGYALSTAGILAIWHQLTSAIVTAGTIGKLILDNLDATISSRSTYAGGAVASVTGSVGGNVVGSVGSVATGGITAASLAADTITDAKVASDVTIASVTGSVGSVTGNVGGNVVGSVASVTAGVTLAASAVQAIWDALTSALTTAGSIGKLLVDNINATISSRLATASYTAPLDAAGTRSAVGLASANLDTQLDALPTAAENADAVWDEDATGHQTQGTFGQAIGDPVADTNTIYKAVVSDATGATVGVDVVAVKAETASIQTDTNDLQTQVGTAGAGLTNINLPDQTMNITGNVTGNVSGSVGSVTNPVTVGAVNAAALADFFDTNSGTVYASAVAGSVVKEIADNAGGGTPPTAAAIADAVWDELKADHTVPDSFGDYLDDEITSRGTGTALDAAGVRSAVGLASANLDTQLGDLPTGAEITDLVWDETTSGHTTAGTTGKALIDAGAAGDPWGTALPGAYGAGTAGKIVGDNLNATVSSRSSHSAADIWASGTRTLTSFGTLVTDITTAVWAAATRTLTAFGFTPTPSNAADTTAILADTNELQTDWANGGRLDVILDARASQASIDALNNLSSAQAQTAAAAALTAYDPPTRTEATSDKDEIITQVNANETKIDTLQTLVNDVPTNAELATALDAIPTANENADALLKRDWTVVTGEAGRSVLNALRFLRNKWSITGTTATITKEDDATTAWTSELTAAAGSDPISGSDPS